MTDDKSPKESSLPNDFSGNTERPTIALESQATDDLKKFITPKAQPQSQRVNLLAHYELALKPTPAHTNNKPTYFADYHKLLMKMGMARFRAAFPYPFLVGIGTVGVLEANNANIADKTSEVYIGEIDEEPTMNPALGGRVWLLQPAEDRTEASYFTLGRSMVNDIVIPEFAISRKHCSFKRSERDLLLQDLGSANGTIVDGQHLFDDASHTVKNLDVLILGRFTFQIFSSPGMIQALYECQLT